MRQAYLDPVVWTPYLLVCEARLNLLVLAQVVV